LKNFGQRKSRREDFIINEETSGNHSRAISWRRHFLVGLDKTVDVFQKSYGKVK
jgi:hypothetical protein